MRLTTSPSCQLVHYATAKHSITDEKVVKTASAEAPCVVNRLEVVKFSAPRLMHKDYAQQLGSFFSST